MRFIVILILTLVFNIAGAQTDTLVRKMQKYTPEFKFNDGIFLSFEHFRNNTPIPKARLLTALDYNSPDFYFELIENPKISLLDDYGLKIEINTKEIGGFSRNGTIFINWNQTFNRIPIIGAVCHFVADKTVVHDRNMYDPYYYNNPYSYYMSPQYATTSNELRQYLLDNETGKVMDYTYQALEIILMRDPALYDEFNQLSKKKKKQLQFMYLRKYNEKHPLMVPVYN